MTQVVFSLAAAKAWRKLPEDVRTRIGAKLDRYAQTGLGDVKAMQGEVGFRLRVGDYRVLFQTYDALIEVQEVGHRRDIYTGRR